jgi:glycosyltransferase involved in cell wall biosynthesis
MQTPQAMRLRIALISLEYPPENAAGGIATYTEQAGHLLAAAGHDVSVFTISSIQTRIEQPLENLRVFWIRPDRSTALQHIRFSLNAESQRASFDVIEAPEFFAQGLSARDQMRHTPLVVKMHTPSQLLYQISHPSGSPPSLFSDWWPQIRLSLGAIRNLKTPYLIQPFLLDKLERKWSSLADRCIALNTDMLRFCVDKWRISPGNIDVIPLPYCPSNALLDIPACSETKVLGFFGRLEYRKGMNVLVESLSEILQQCPQLTVHFVGAIGKDPVSLQDYDKVFLDKLPHFRGRLKFFGKVPPPDIPKHLALVDLVVTPSVWENFPLVVLESMAAGKCIIGSDVGGIRDQLDSGRAGALFQSGNSRQFANTVIDLHRNSAERYRLGVEARKRVLTCYSAQNIGQRMVDSFRTAIADRQRNAVDSCS